MKRPSLEERIIAARKAGRFAKVPFITAGFPDEERFCRAVVELDANGADIIEIGIPFSDPVADGPVVEDASRRVLEKGMTLHRTLDLLRPLAADLQAGLVFMGYYNPFLQYGLERLADDSAAMGVQGFIVPDLPLEESGPMRKALDARGIDLIALVGPNTGDERMREYAGTARGYVYVVSTLGTTGVRKNLPPEAEHTVGRARNAFRVPVALGFGLSHPDQVRAMADPPDVLVFGSSLLRHLDAGGSAAEYMERWAAV
ncbi:MAG: tryptophan synthase subunit alpha [Deltaproteobacteria bacterium]|nr:tryptophan synthase subunit alpha [Deltaproteobacteria bacterium]